METNLITILAAMGGISLYLVIASAVGRSIYDRLKNMFEDDRIILSIIGGVFFPVTVPISILVLWLVAQADNMIPTKKESDTDNTFSAKEIEKMKEETREEYQSSAQKVIDNAEDFDKEKVKKVNAEFKVGDLVTGAEGNPGEYEVFYPGCKCRVIDVNEEDEEMTIKLIDHIDKKAHEEDIGSIEIVDFEDFTLIKPKRKPVKKKVTKKKK